MSNLFKAILISLMAINCANAGDGEYRVIRKLTDQPYSAPEKPEIYQADLTIDTLFYEAAYTPWYWTIPNRAGDDSFNVRFDPPRDFGRFGILGVLIPLVDIPLNLGGPIGTPGMSVTVYESGEQDGELGFPTSIVDGVRVPFDSLQFGSLENHPFNFIDLRQLGIGYNSERPFHIVVSIIADTTSDTLAIFSDEGRVQTSRSGLKDGRQRVWAKMLELPGVDLGLNFAIRAIIADSILGVYSLDPNTGNILPVSAELGSAFPNPFNSSSKLAFGVPVGTPYRAALFDPLGRQRAELASGIGNGRGFITLDAKDLSTGVYIVRLWTPYSIQAQRVMLIR